MCYDMTTVLGGHGMEKGGLKEEGPIGSCIFMLSPQLANCFWKLEEMLPCWRCVTERVLRFQKLMPGPVCVCLSAGWYVRLSAASPAPCLSAFTMTTMD